jgi:hypothetical protein
MCYFPRLLCITAVVQQKMYIADIGAEQGDLQPSRSHQRWYPFAEIYAQWNIQLLGRG